MRKVGTDVGGTRAVFGDCTLDPLYNGVECSWGIPQVKVLCETSCWRGEEAPDPRPNAGNAVAWLQERGRSSILTSSIGADWEDVGWSGSPRGSLVT